MKKLLTLAPLLLLLGGFLFLRPPLLGGATSYVIVTGRSMQPTLRTGDLVLARSRASGYTVGDVVAYHPPDANGLIITASWAGRGRASPSKGTTTTGLTPGRPCRSRSRGRGGWSSPAWGRSSPTSSPRCGWPRL